MGRPALFLAYSNTIVATSVLLKSLTSYDLRLTSQARLPFRFGQCGKILILIQEKILLSRN